MKRMHTVLTCGIVREANRQTVLGQLVRVCGCHNPVTRNRGVNDLRANILVAESHRKTVLGRVILVLVLGHQTISRAIIGLAS